MELNQKQKEAVETEQGPILVVAGAGAGKTRVITERIKRLIEKGVAAKEILAVTFTNKAAEEMKQRIGIMNPGPFIGTFHRLGLLIIKENLKALNIGKYFTILDEDDSQDLIKDCQKELNIDHKQYDPRKFKNKISGMKNILLTHEFFEENSLWEDFLKRIWTFYEEKKKIQNALDFDDLLMLPANLLRFDEKILEIYQNRWQFIHIDEYQDTNEAQYILSKLLAISHKNIFAVGDIDQAIYSWRGADFKNILNFQKDYPEAKIITLEQNYRSTDIVLEAANAVILNNKARLPKNLIAQRQGKELIRVIFGVNEKDEAQNIVKEIASLYKNKEIKWSDVAILYRTNAQSRALEEAMLTKSVPYKVFGGFRFYERKEVKDILAYLRLAQNSLDTISKKRILNVPPRGIGKTLMLKVFGGIQELSSAERKKISDFEKLMEALRMSANASFFTVRGGDGVTKSAYDTIQTLIKKIGYKEFINDGTEKGTERWLNVQELLTIAKNRSLEEFLEHVSLFSADDKNDALTTTGGKVTLMTAHMAKGLEFEAVVISGLEEGIFPHILSMKPAEIEEERRLFYVALTRAKTRLYLSLTANRTIFGSTNISTPSRFLGEIPEYLLAYLGQPKNYEHEIEENIYVE
ncbi:MAG: UvrD-helicase domain-containing protein [Patescibacteria group bacterium]